MKHQVYKSIESLLEIDNFVGATHKFSKKFYTITIHGGEHTPYRLEVKAIAISRDLIYRISWVMDAQNYDPERVISYDDVYRSDAPILHWIPKHDQDLSKLYPNVMHTPDEPGEHHWITIFESWGFQRVDNIQTIE